MTLRARTYGVRPQIWSIDGRYRVTVEPSAVEGSFVWNHVMTLPLSAAITETEQQTVIAALAETLHAMIGVA